MRPVFLIGYMGCGKSTLGRALSRLTGITLIDLDTYIESRFHRTVTELFAERGESGFREIETAMLEEVASFEDVIVACGGGTPCFGRNMEVMNQAGLTVWLNTPRDVLLRRLIRGKHKRPLIAQKTDDELGAFIDAALEARETFYSQAQAQFCGANLEDKSQIDTTARAFITRFLQSS
ncbi:MAG: shikimate kinase [Bacteroidales bacterium]|nr:shikimate kinase [Bacteroidales bacterium]